MSNFHKGDLTRYLRDGAGRSFLGQGVALGWGDEIEAWVRSKLGDEEYEDLLKDIRGKNTTHKERYDYTEVPELIGNFIPFLGANPVSPLGMALAGGVEAGISGAGEAEEGKFSEGALSAAIGALLGGGIGKGAQKFQKWRGGKVAPSQELVPAFAEGGQVEGEKESQLLRALLGQGLGMGWGDEIEAGARSLMSGHSPFEELVLGETEYERNLREIRSKYGEYADENPGTTLAAEFVGGAIPGVAAMFLPGLQGQGGKQLANTTRNAIMRGMGTGAASGVVAGAGAADEDRTAGALSGGVLGLILGGALPAASRGVSGGASWMRERLAPTVAGAERSAAEKMAKALSYDNMIPADIQRVLAGDTSLNVPSVVANASPSVAALAETVAQRGGRGSRLLEETLEQNKAGSRDRVTQRLAKDLKAGDYYADEAKMMEDLRQKAGPLYDQAYAHGTVDDPRIAQVLTAPQFKMFFNKAKEIADMEAKAAELRGENPAKYRLKQIYRGTGEIDPLTGQEAMELVDVPDVRTLDYIKRGIDTVIDRGFDGKGISKPEANALRALRREFIGAIDQNVPKYAAARAAYAGDMEILDSLRSGMEDFNKLDHEQIQSLFKTASTAEKDAFRTGVTRSLYSKVMDPAQNINAAQRVIGSPETQKKLEALFDSPAQYKLFEAAMKREAYLFHQANKITQGSQTAKRNQMLQAFEGDTAMGDAMRDIMTGGWWNSVTNMTGRFLRSADVSDATAEKLAKMLVSSNPNEVAAVVKLMDDHLASLGPKELKMGMKEAGAITGATSSFWSPPENQEATPGP